MEHSRLVLKGPDGQPLRKNDVILLRRGAFRWMPVGFSNDLVYGSWWFVSGSILMTLSPIYPLYEKFERNYEQTDDLLPESDFYSIWILMIICGVFFLLGSLAFTRAFNEPPLKPLFADFKHLQTDELLASWCYLFGMMPFMPYMFIFFIDTSEAIYFFGFLGALLFTYASYLGVISCYPRTDEQVEYTSTSTFRHNTHTHTHAHDTFPILNSIWLTILCYRLCRNTRTRCFLSCCGGSELSCG